MSIKLLLINIILITLCLCSYGSQRTLQDPSLLIRVCNKSDADYSFQGESKSLSDYIKSFTDKQPSPFLIGLIEGSDNITEGLDDFLLSKIAYIIMIGFGIISLISIYRYIIALVWPILWCICCCKCCCFSKTKKAGACGYINYGFAIGLFAAILAMSIIGLSQSTYVYMYNNV